MAPHLGGLEWLLFSAEQKGGPFRWVNLATPEGGSIWQVYSAVFGKGKQSIGKEKESKAIEKKEK
jgi:hypothetical protein